MAKFLNTTGISYHLEELIKGTKERLILISPYLQLSETIKGLLANLNDQKRDIRIIFRENKLPLDANNWLEKQIGVRTSICKNLHAKCYLNEYEAIVTSMNLYEFSQLNNYEMGIHISRSADPELYNSTVNEAERLLKISQEVRVMIPMVSSAIPERTINYKEATNSYKRQTDSSLGFCLRTGVAIPFDIDKPLSREAYKKWNEFGDSDYPEKYCHFSGELSYGETSMYKPVLSKYWKKASVIHHL